MIAGLIHSFWVMVAMFALAGVGNTVYHPADYAMLSHHVPADRIGQAFSVHTFAGMLGSAVAPASLLMMQSLWGWRGAFIGAGLLGFAVAALLLAMRDNADVEHGHAAARGEDGATRGRLAAFAVAGDPAQSRLLRAARDDERRHVQLFRGRVRRALWQRR